MGLFGGIREAFNSVATTLNEAFTGVSEKVHDVFYTPKETVGDDYITVTPAPEKYDEWLIEQNAFEFGVWTDFSDIFKEGDTP